MTKWYENEITKEIIKRKYLQDGETFDDFINRVTSIFYYYTNEIKEAILNGDFFPGGSVLASAGVSKKMSPMNCYVLPSPEDSIEGIYKTNREMARVFSYRGGVGIALESLRPKGAKVGNAAKTSTGAVSFLELFNTTGQVIGMNGRRSATMICLDCRHPDLEEFLNIKETNHKLESMNISIKFTDDFFRAVIQDKPWELRYKVEATGEVISKTIDAREFFKRFCRVNFDFGDPGAIFIDTVRRNNLLSGYDEYVINSPNP